MARWPVSGRGRRRQATVLQNLVLVESLVRQQGFDQCVRAPCEARSGACGLILAFTGDRRDFGIDGAGSFFTEGLRATVAFGAAQVGALVRRGLHPSLSVMSQRASRCRVRTGSFVLQTGGTTP